MKQYLYNFTRLSSGGQFAGWGLARLSLNWIFLKLRPVPSLSHAAYPASSRFLVRLLVVAEVLGQLLFEDEHQNGMRCEPDECRHKTWRGAAREKRQR